MKTFDFRTLLETLLRMETISMSCSFNLYRLTDGILKSFLPLAARRNSHFINNIPAELEIEADAELVSSILGGLLATLLSRAPGSSISLSAKNYKSGILLMHMRNCNITDNTMMEEELNRLQKLADKIGGIIGVGGQRQELTTLTFSFPYLQLAA